MPTWILRQISFWEWVPERRANERKNEKEKKREREKTQYYYVGFYWL